jgi:exosome complex exonuclease DIS3/RRP44
LTLASSEVRFELETGPDGRPDPRSLPTAMALSSSDAAHSLIEEFMVLANCLVARKTAEAFPNQVSARDTLAFCVCLSSAFFILLAYPSLPPI